jgi:hypothetical protein
MRRLATLLLTVAVGLGLASTAEAIVVEWPGTLELHFLWLDISHPGTGVATLNGSNGSPYAHLNTIRLPGGLSYTGGNNVPETIPLTDPDHPTLITLRATGLRLGTITFDGISGGPPLGSQNTAVPLGHMRMCILFPGCAHYLPIPFAKDASNAVGVGGSFTVNGLSKGNGFRLSVQGAPWTIGLASIRNVTTETSNGGVLTYTATIQGFVHGPASGSSTPGVPLWGSGLSSIGIVGLVQLVTPVSVQTNLEPPYSFSVAWLELKLNMIPEPGRLLLLGSGIAGLLLLGRARMRR